jgi:hypothetical protein
MSEMNRGLQILLERVKSNPEEFTPDITGRYPEKWRPVLNLVQLRMVERDQAGKHLDFLSDEEIAVLWRAMQDVRGDQFTRQIMNTLLRDSDMELSFYSTQRPSDRLRNSLKAKLA